MQVDSYFTIGTSHKVCEDYALHGKIDQTYYGVLSDGCSASPFADFGARFICVAAVGTLRMFPHFFNPNAVFPLASSMIGRELPWACLDATCVLVYSVPLYLCAQVMGDGILVARDSKKHWNVKVIEFSSNAPGYLTYLFDAGRYNAFEIGMNLNEEGGVRKITESYWTPDFSKILHESVTTEKVKFVASDFWYGASYHHQDYDLVVGLSDGTQFFQRLVSLERGKETIPLPEVLKALLPFETLQGDFVTKRCEKFFNEFCKTNGWTNYDDVSMVAIYDDK